MISFSVKSYVLFSAFFVVQGTLIPNGTVPLDCRSQQTFNCIVTGPSAVWTISELSGISESDSNGQFLANRNARINTTDTMGVTQSSTITITGFTTADNGGTIRCIDLNTGIVQGMANVSVELPSCPTSFSAIRDVDFTSVTVTYQLDNPPPGTSTTVSYCPTLSPNCGNSVNCTSTGACTISGLHPCVEYNVSAIPTNNCGGATGCTSMVVDSQGKPPALKFNVNFDTSTSVLVTWNPPNSPLVTLVTVTYCTTLSSSCENSANCTNTPCNISGLAPRMEYNFTFTPNNNCGSGTSSAKQFNTTPPPASPTTPGLPIVAIVVPIVAAIILVVLIVIIVIVVVIWCMKKKHSVKDNSSARMSRLRSNEERANLGEDTYASPGTGKPQPETTDGVYSYAATETKIGAQMKEREQQKKQPPPQGDFYEEPNAAKNVQHKTGTITGETYAQPDKPKRGTKKKNKQQPEPVPHKEAPAGELYAMPDKKKDVSHTSGPVTGDEYAVASKPKTGGGYGAHGPQ